MKNAVAYPLWVLVGCAIWHLIQTRDHDVVTTLNGRVVRIDHESGAVSYPTESGWVRADDLARREAMTVASSVPKQTVDVGAHVIGTHYPRPRLLLTEEGWQPDQMDDLSFVVYQPEQLKLWLKHHSVTAYKTKGGLKIYGDTGKWIALPELNKKLLVTAFRANEIQCLD